jgi:uncharacterized protein
MGAPATHNLLSAALLGRTRGALLALFYGHPDESFYVREVLRAVKTGPGALQRELARMEQAGILRRWRRGSQVYYQANPECPVFRELLGLVLKTVGAVGVLKAALQPLAGRVDSAFVYGSLARDEARAGSDIDLCVIGRVTFAEVAGATGAAQEALRREVNPTVFPRAEFARKLAEKHHFLTAIVSGPKLFLIGGERELARLG